MNKNVFLNAEDIFYWTKKYWKRNKFLIFFNGMIEIIFVLIASILFVFLQLFVFQYLFWVSKKRKIPRNLFEKSFYKIFNSNIFSSFQRKNITGGFHFILVLEYMRKFRSFVCTMFWRKKELSITYSKIYILCLFKGLNVCIYTLFYTNRMISLHTQTIFLSLKNNRKSYHA